MNIRPELWPELSQLLDQALELAPEAREPWLLGLPPAMAAHGPALKALLAAHARVETSDFMGALPPLLAPDGAPDPVAEASLVGRQVGPYVVEAELGRGGMGTVWRARRADGALNRPVALKLPHLALRDRDGLGRFARERDILAALEHPNIARLYDAGTTSDGQVYLALEYVVGEPLIAYADARQLGVDARLALFRQVLEAVGYAHRHLTIHRDLKPANILVDAEGRVRLLDFGVARLLPAEGAADGALTEFGTRALTPEYAAPEQLLGGSVTTGTDVYSLGVVLYELLTGTRPYRLGSRRALEDAIVNVDAARPSRSPLSDAEALARGTTPARLRARLAGDLDTIVLKALKKDPLERYPTVDAMLQDLGRHQRNEPVLARPDQAWYRIGRFVARHKLPVALACALAVAVVGGLAVALTALHTARVHAARADAVKGLLLQAFSAGTPGGSGGKEVTAKEVLERGSQQIDAELKGQPGLLAELHGALANIYGSFGANEDALAHASKALALFEAGGDRESEDYFGALYRVADGYKEEERWPEARAAYARLHREARAHYRGFNVWEAMALEGEIWMDQWNGRLAKAEADSRAALEAMKALYGEHSKQYLRVLGSTEQLYLDRGRPLEALDFIQRVLALAPSVPDYGLADLLMDRYMLGSTLYRLQRYAESADELRRLLPDMERHMGPGNDRTSKARNTLALDLMQLGELPEALALQERNLKILKDARTGDESLLTGQSVTLARILARADRLDEALPIQQRAIAFFDALYAAPTPYREFARSYYGETLVRVGRTADGFAALDASLKNLESIKGYAPDPNYADALLMAGNAARLLGRGADADDRIGRACALFDSTLGAQTVAALRCRVYRLLARGQGPEAVAALQAPKAALLASLPPHQALRAELALVEAELARRSGSAASAAVLEANGRREYKALVGVEPVLPLRALH